MADNPNNPNSPDDGAPAIASTLEAFRKSIISPLGAFEAGLQALSFALNEINETLQEFNDINQRLSVVNTNLGSLINENSAALEASEYGFSLATKALTELKVAGFDKANKNITDLVARTKLQGQDTRKLIDVNQKLLSFGNIQISEIGDLNKSILDNSLRYGITTDALVESIQSLEKNLLSLQVGGGVTAAADAITKLTAVFGVENQKLVETVVGEITSTQGNFQIQALLGLENVGDRIFFGQQLSTESLVNAIVASSKTSSKLLSGALDSQSRRALAATVGGNDKLVLAVNALGSNIDEKLISPLQKGFDAFKNTLNFFVETAFGPFKESVSRLFPSFENISIGIAKLIGPLLTLVTDTLGAGLAVVLDLLAIAAVGVGSVLELLTPLTKLISVTLTSFSVGLNSVFKSLSGSLQKEDEAREREELRRASFETDPINRIRLDEIDRLSRDTSTSQTVQFLQMFGGKLGKEADNLLRVLQLIELNTQTGFDPVATPS
jgi:hypothetical protein